jgi:hypothetical protein
MAGKPKESLSVKTWLVRRSVFERLRGYRTKITDGHGAACSRDPIPESSQLAAKGTWSTTAQVRASGEIGKSQYVIFEDGAVVIETPKGVRRFKDLQELISKAKSPRSINTVGSSD